MVYPIQERVVELQQIKFRQTMKVVCVYFRISVVQSARYRKHSCGLKFLSLVLECHICRIIFVILGVEIYSAGSFPTNLSQ